MSRDPIIPEEVAATPSTTPTTKNLIAAIKSENNSLVRLLLDQGADPNPGALEDIIPPLETAVTYGNSLETIRLLIERGADVNPIKYYLGPLGAAVDLFPRGGESPRSAGLDKARLLIEHGADVNVSPQMRDYGNLLTMAVTRGKSDLARLLVENGADVNLLDEEFGSSLTAAAFNSNLDMARFFMVHGADVNSRNGDFGTPLMAASSEGTPEMVEFLIENGADVNLQDEKHGNALFSAISAQSQAMVALLLEHGARVDVQPWTSDRSSLLHSAILHHNFDVLSLLCDAGGDVHLTSQDVSGLTPLHVAVIEG